MAQKQAIEFEIVNIYQHVEWGLNLLANDLKSNSIETHIQIPKDLEAKAQPTQFDQVLLNLFKNAIDALKLSHNPRILTIEATYSRDQLVLTVCDNGIGIAPELQQSLFKPFNTNKNDGLGLGLSISQSSIEKHYGKLKLHHSQPGETVFEIKIPIGKEI